ncbi:MAG: 50S ribosomal protein L13 [Bdellovibrionota bacterium]
MSTYFESVENARKQQKWVIVDAADKVVGRLASEVASILRGKRNPRYTPHVDTGDFVVIINASKIRFTGSKPEKKTYYKHTGFIGGMKEAVAGELLEQKPEEVIIHAVRGMLPKSTLGRNQLLKLKIYRGAEHPHAAQQPQAPKFGPLKQ